MDYGLNQIPRLREYINVHTLKRHRLLAEAARDSGKVSFNWKYLRAVKFFPHHPIRTTMPFHQKNQVGKTFFKEVKVAPPKMTEAVKRYAQNPNPESVKQPVRVMSKVIEREWNSDHFHLQLHSSGYDSRLISGILMELREKHGAGWIGDMFFLCWEPDGPCFRKIMEWEGWKKNQYHIYREGVGVDYRAELVDFENVGRWVNDYSVPHLCAAPAVEDAKRRGLIPKDRDIHVIIGISSVVQPCVWELPEPRIHYRNPQVNGILMKREVHANFANWSGISCKEIWYPMCHIEVAASMGQHEKRVRILKRFNRELYSLPRFPHKAAYRKPNWLCAPGKLSEKTRIKAAKSYNDSWFAKETKQREVMMSPDLNHGITVNQDLWWRNYVLASTCEYLIKCGVKIKND